MRPWVDIDTRSIVRLSVPPPPPTPHRGHRRRHRLSPLALFERSPGSPRGRDGLRLCRAPRAGLRRAGRGAGLPFGPLSRGHSGGPVRDRRVVTHNEHVVNREHRPRGPVVEEEDARVGTWPWRRDQEECTSCRPQCPSRKDPYASWVSSRIYLWGMPPQVCWRGLALPWPPLRRLQRWPRRSVSTLLLRQPSHGDGGSPPVAGTSESSRWRGIKNDGALHRPGGHFRPSVRRGPPPAR